MKLSLIASLFIVNALASPRNTASPDPAASPDPSEVYFLEPPTYDGSGCPQGHAVVSLTRDNESFTVTMEKLIATAGPTYQGAEPDRVNCQISAKMHVPQGWQYSIVLVTYRGYINLDKGVRATLTVRKILFQTPLEENFFFPMNYCNILMFKYKKIQHSFAETTGTRRILGDFLGPVNGRYQVTDKVNYKRIGEVNYEGTDEVKNDGVAEEVDIIWSKCGSSTSLDINSEVHVDTSKSQGSSGKITVDSVDKKIEQTYVTKWRKCLE
jgi:hypothetical protein